MGQIPSPHPIFKFSFQCLYFSFLYVFLLVKLFLNCTIIFKYNALGCVCVHVCNIGAGIVYYKYHLLFFYHLPLSIFGLDVLPRYIMNN